MSDVSRCSSLVLSVRGNRVPHASRSVRKRGAGGNSQSRTTPSRFLKMAYGVPIRSKYTGRSVKGILTITAGHDRPCAQAAPTGETSSR